MKNDEDVIHRDARDINSVLIPASSTEENVSGDVQGEPTQAKDVAIVEGVQIGSHSMNKTVSC